MNTTGTPLPPESTYNSSTPERSAAESRRDPGDRVADCGVVKTVDASVAPAASDRKARVPAPARFKKTLGITGSFRNCGDPSIGKPPKVVQCACGCCR